MAPAPFERAVVVIAGIVLAACAFLCGPLDPRVLWAYLLFSPPFVCGALVAALAACSGLRARQALITTTETVIALTAVAWGALGIIMMILPGLFITTLFLGWYELSRRGDTEERGARVALATGALWAIVFSLVALQTSVLGVHLAVIASVSMTVAGLAWLREIRRTRPSGGPPLARLRRS
jgi:hypothetical protein